MLLVTAILLIAPIHNTPTANNRNGTIGYHMLSYVTYGIVDTERYFA